MFKNILLMVLILVNIAFMINFQQTQSIDYFSFNVIITGLTLIICVLYLITHTNRVALILSLLTLCVALYHALMLILRVYHYVYL